MEGIGMDVQAVLQDIYNDEENELEQPSVPYPKSLPYPYHARAERLFIPRQTPASTYHQNAMYDLRNSGPLAPISAHTQVSDSNNGLDIYGDCERASLKVLLTNRWSGRGSLAKPQPLAHTDWQTGSSLSISPPRLLGRILLPDHTAPAAFSHSNPLEQRLPHRKKASGQCSRATCGQSIADACKSYPLQKISNHTCVSHLCTLVAG